MSKNTNQRKPRYRRAPVSGFRLQPRDTQIIQQVYKHRFLTSRHIMALAGGSEQGVQRRLHRLFHIGYLDRPSEQIKPYVRGSEPMVYGLGNKGADLLAQEFKIPRSKVDWTTKNREVKQQHIDHTLMVAHFMVCLELACKKIENLDLIGPTEILNNMSADIRNKNNPYGFKTRASRKVQGQARNINFSIIPDKVFGLFFLQDSPGQNKALFLLEADRSTMPIKRSNIYKSSYQHKMVGYWESWKQGKFSQIFGFKAARVLTITISQERITNMISAGKEVDARGKGSRMFLFAQSSDFTVGNPEHIFEPIWQNGRDRQLVSLLD